jgi:hypothetical protein
MTKFKKSIILNVIEFMTPVEIYKIMAINKMFFNLNYFDKQILSYLSSFTCLRSDYVNTCKFDNPVKCHFTIIELLKDKFGKSKGFHQAIAVYIDIMYEKFSYDSIFIKVDEDDEYIHVVKYLSCAKNYCYFFESNQVSQNVLEVFKKMNLVYFNNETLPKECCDKIQTTYDQILYHNHYILDKIRLYDDDEIKYKSDISEQTQFEGLLHLINQLIEEEDLTHLTKAVFYIDEQVKEFSSELKNNLVFNLLKKAFNLEELYYYEKDCIHQDDEINVHFDLQIKGIITLKFTNSYNFIKELIPFIVIFLKRSNIKVFEIESYTNNEIMCEILEGLSKEGVIHKVKTININNVCIVNSNLSPFDYIKELEVEVNYNEVYLGKPHITKTLIIFNKGFYEYYLSSVNTMELPDYFNSIKCKSLFVGVITRGDYEVDFIKSIAKDKFFGLIKESNNSIHKIIYNQQ